MDSPPPRGEVFDARNRGAVRRPRAATTPSTHPPYPRSFRLVSMAASGFRPSHSAPRDGVMGRVNSFMIPCPPAPSADAPLRLSFQAGRVLLRSTPHRGPHRNNHGPARCAWRRPAATERPDEPYENL